MPDPAPVYSQQDSNKTAPLSEAHIETMKYQPAYPERFGSQVDERTWTPSYRPNGGTYAALVKESCPNTLRQRSEGSTDP